MAFDLRVRTDDLRQAVVVPAPAAADVALAPGEALLAVDRFALTANNVTYGAIADLIGYWKFFPAPAGWGRIPVWGFAEVLRSEHDGVAPGERVFGYLPMSTHVVAQADAVTPGSFVDAAPHRAGLPDFYNRYLRCAADAGYDPAREGELALFRPLFGTAFLLDDWLAEHAAAARRVVMSSASSKTALGLAFMLRQRDGVDAVGLTSARNHAFVAGTGSYDAVIAYDESGTLDPGVPTAYVDFSGNADLLGAVHARLAPGLVASVRVGATDWEHLAPPADAAPLPGPEPSLFFAPAQAAQRAAEWGPAELQARLGTALTAFIGSTDAWLRLVEGSGPDAIVAAWQTLVEGTADPAEGLVLSPGM